MKLNGKGSKRHLFILPLLLLFLNVDAFAQNEEPRSININMNATEILPADLMVFNVQINAEEESPQKAFETHKERESVLASLLKKFDIDEKDIKYDPIRISKKYRGEDDRKTTVTHQSVTVTFNDFSIYEKIQVALIENGFDSFNGQFSSTDVEKGKEKALAKAIEEARNKAELIAKAAGVQLSEVLNIHYSDHQINYAARSYSEMSMQKSDDSMMDFPQTVSVMVNINISFGIQ